MNSSHSDSCFVENNTCPITTNTGYSHINDVTIEFSKLAVINSKSFIETCSFLAFNTTHTTTVTKDSCVHGNTIGTSLFV